MLNRNPIRLTRPKKILAWLVILALVILVSLKVDIYMVGGDDTRLYYLYPEKFISNFATNIVIGNSLSNLNSYTSQGHLLPLMFTLTGLKNLLIDMNLQVFMYSLNIIFGMYFFYKLVALFIRIEDKYSQGIVLLSSLLYVFSIFVFYSVFRHQLLTIYLLSIFPITLFLIVLGLKKRKLIYPIISALVLSVSGILFVSIPWFIALLVVNTPIFTYLLLRYKKRFVKHSLVFTLIIFLLNAYWLLHLLGSIFLYSGSIGASTYLTSGFRQSNLWGIRLISSMNRLIYPLDFLYQYDIQSNFHWNLFGIYKSWYLKLLPINLILSTIIFVGGAIKNRKRMYSFVFILGALVLTIFLLTSNISPLGIEAFVFLSKNIPGFVIFRNMYDKFALPFSFIFSLSLAVASVKILRTIKQNHHRVLFVLFFGLVIFVNILPAIRGDFFKLKLWTTNVTTDLVTDINPDYVELSRFISKQEDIGKYLMLPLSSGNNYMIQGEDDINSYYVGVSPLVVFSGREDFSGSISFSYFSDPVMSAIMQRRYEDAYYYFKILNIRYVVVNKNVSEDLQQSRFYGQSLYDSQMKTDFVNNITGRKIKDFGERYSLYEINDKYRTDRVYLSEQLHSFGSGNVNSSIEKISNEEFIYRFDDPQQNKYLNFLVTKNSGWDLYNSKGKKISPTDQFTIFNYANAWEISDYTPFKTETGDYEITIKFTPAKYSKYFYAISGTALLGVVIYLLVTYKRDVKSKQN